MNGVLENRELSWLAFNERVLAEAGREELPLLERLRFAAIFSSNLEEFFMVRTGVLINRRLADDTVPDHRTMLRPSEQLARIYERVRELTARRADILRQTEERLSAAGVKRLRPSELDPAQRSIADIFFEEQIRPLLTVTDPQEPASAPFIPGGRLCAVCILTDGGTVFAVCPENAPKLAALPAGDGFAYILTEDILAERAAELAEGVCECAVFTVTRSADVRLDDIPAADMPYTDAVRQAVSLRGAMPAVRVRSAGSLSAGLRGLLCGLLSLEEGQVFEDSAPLDMGYVSALTGVLGNRPELFYPPFTPSADEDPRPVIDRVLEGDMLLSFPYESFDRFLRLLDEAAGDVRVTEIKMTLYRTAHGSRVVDALCKAARNGKKVTAVVELKARFDELHNLGSAEKLKAAGCRVVYGLYGVKVHSKLCLIALNEGGELVRITQTGTGNYNEVTAAHYTDLSLLTADPEIAADAEDVFEAICAGRLPDGAYSLMVSPMSLKERIMSFIDGEIAAADSGAAAYFGAKLNGLSDRDLIAKLIEASRHGVKIDLIVRGICCLIPGVPGATDNIRVISVIGRFLEHARIYIFGSGMRQRVFISSADLMTRNTRRRIEAAAPVRDRALRKRVTDYFAAQLADTDGAWEKRPDGTYVRLSAVPAVSSQRKFMEEQGYSEKSPEKVELTKPAEYEQPAEEAPENADLTKPAEHEQPAEETPENADLTEPAEPEPPAEETPENADLTKPAEPEQPAEEAPENADLTEPAEPEQPAEEASENADLTEPAEPEQPAEEAPEAAALPPAVQPQKMGFFARIAAFFRRLGKG